MSKKSRKRKSSNKNFIALLVIIVVLVGGIYYIRDLEKKEAYEISLNPQNDEVYHVLENRDTVRYIESIELGQNRINILDLSQDFYGNKVFWPYIFQVNQHIENPLDMPKGTVLLIPRVDSLHLDLTATGNVERVRFIGDSILTAVNERRKPREFD
ncbi:hypothetical protein [Viscerimonas tarda]